MPLNKILKNSSVHKNGKGLVAIFDLDSTVFDVSPRTEQIMKNLAANADFQKRYPEQCKALSKISVESTDWGIKDSLSRHKIEGTIDFFEEVREHWKTYFFHNDYLHLDQPYEGAIEYIKELHKKGARIVYLTGRDVHRMGEGTKRVLLNWELPVNDHHKLILKPQKGMDDATFKRDVIIEIEAEHDETWLFENEPVNISIVERYCPNVKIVFLDSTHSNREDSPSHHHTLPMKYHW